MKYSKSINIVITVLLLFIVQTTTYSQKSEPKVRVLEPDHTISSKIMEKDYQLYISFPIDYSNNNTTKYPVLYVLDGQFMFPIIAGTRGGLDMANELEKVIIVCIGSGLDYTSWYVNRMYDYTTAIDTTSENGTDKAFKLPKGTTRTGGAERFLQCITKEIIPFVDLHYKTTNDRGITGHSLGGLFTAYCLLNSNGIFTKFGISSPSLWWDQDALIKQSNTQFSKNKSWEIPTTKVFMSVGKKEGPTMVPKMSEFASSLQRAAYNNITLRTQIFDEETHLSVIPANVSRTLSSLYGKVNGMSNGNKKELSALLYSGKTVDEVIAIVTQQDKQAPIYDISEDKINGLGYYFMTTAKQNEEALKLFKLNTELYPEAFNTFDSLGECLLILGDQKNAIKAYNKSIELNPKNENAVKVLAELKSQKGKP